MVTVYLKLQSLKAHTWRQQLSRFTPQLQFEFSRQPSLSKHHSGLVTLVLNNLNPVVVRVKQEGNVLHAPVSESLLPVALQVLKTLARRVKIVNTNACKWSVGCSHYIAACVQNWKMLTDVAKSLGLVIAVVVLEVLVLFGAVVPGKLQETLAVSLLALLSWALFSFIAEEVQVESGSGGLAGSHE